MTKQIQKLKKQLLKEELRRQGKTPRYRRWLLGGVSLLVLGAGCWLWYHASLQTLLGDRFQTALARKESGAYSDALAALQQLHAEHPGFEQNPRVLFETAQLLDIYLGRYDEALLTYLLVLRDFPEDARQLGVQPRIAELYKYRMGDCGQAVAVYQQLLDQTDEEADRWQYEVGDCYFRLNNYEQARIEFEGLQKRFTRSVLLPQVQFRIAVTYALEDKLPEAAASYRLVAETWPDDPYALEARFGLATVLEEQELLLESLSVLKSLVDLYPNQASLRQRIEQVQARIDKKKKAI